MRSPLTAVRSSGDIQLIFHSTWFESSHNELKLVHILILQQLILFPQLTSRQMPHCSFGIGTQYPPKELPNLWQLKLDPVNPQLQIGITLCG